MSGSSEPDRAAVFFADAEEFRAWLEDNHETATELWMGLYRKGDPDRGLTWDEAVPVALCYGWIDSVSQRIDDRARRQRWTPRKPSSNWSAVNIAHVERLLALGLMRPAGIAAYERRAQAAPGYSYEQRVELGPDELAQIAANPAAQAFWDEATASYRRLAATWVLGAKREQTRADRLATLVADCAAGRLVPPQRYGDPPAWLTRAAAAAAAASGEPAEPDAAEPDAAGPESAEPGR
jgi:uncharacterized protein YdeI (YjbR/CyaY-like superfamily)